MNMAVTAKRARRGRLDAVRHVSDATQCDMKETNIINASSRPSQSESPSIEAKSSISLAVVSETSMVTTSMEVANDCRRNRQRYCPRRKRATNIIPCLTKIFLLIIVFLYGCGISLIASSRETLWAVYADDSTNYDDEAVGDDPNNYVNGAIQKQDGESVEKSHTTTDRIPGQGSIPPTTTTIDPSDPEHSAILNNDNAKNPTQDINSENLEKESREESENHDQPPLTVEDSGGPEEVRANDTEFESWHSLPEIADDNSTPSDISESNEVDSHTTQRKASSGNKQRQMSVSNATEEVNVEDIMTHKITADATSDSSDANNNNNVDVTNNIDAKEDDVIDAKSAEAAAAATLKKSPLAWIGWGSFSSSTRNTVSTGASDAIATSASDTQDTKTGNGSNDSEGDSSAMPSSSINTKTMDTNVVEQDPHTDSVEIAANAHHADDDGLDDGSSSMSTHPPVAGLPEKTMEGSKILVSSAGILRTVEAEDTKNDKDVLPLDSQESAATDDIGHVTTVDDSSTVTDDHEPNQQQEQQDSEDGEMKPRLDVTSEENADDEQEQLNATTATSNDFSEKDDANVTDATATEIEEETTSQPQVGIYSTIREDLNDSKPEPIQLHNHTQAEGGGHDIITEGIDEVKDTNHTSLIGWNEGQTDEMLTDQSKEDGEEVTEDDQNEADKLPEGYEEEGEGDEVSGEFELKGSSNGTETDIEMQRDDEAEEEVAKDTLEKDATEQTVPPPKEGSLASFFDKLNKQDSTVSSDGESNSTSTSSKPGLSASLSSSSTSFERLAQQAEEENALEAYYRKQQQAQQLLLRQQQRQDTRTQQQLQENDELLKLPQQDQENFLPPTSSDATASASRKRLYGNNEENAHVSREYDSYMRYGRSWGVYSKFKRVPDMELLYKVFEKRVHKELGIFPESVLKEAIFPLGIGNTVDEEDDDDDDDDDDGAIDDHIAVGGDGDESTNTTLADASEGSLPSSSSSAENEFVQGLDDIDKFFEEVDPPEELDVGAGGSSIQEVLMGQGRQILFKRIMLGIRSLKNTYTSIKTSVSQHTSAIVRRFQNEEGKFAITRQGLVEMLLSLFRVFRRLLRAVADFIDYIISGDDDDLADYGDTGGLDKKLSDGPNFGGGTDDDIDDKFKIESLRMGFRDPNSIGIRTRTSSSSSSTSSPATASTPGSFGARISQAPIPQRDQTAQDGRKEDDEVSETTEAGLVEEGQDKSEEALVEQ